MTPDFPKVVAVRRHRQSPWVTILERDVLFAPGGDAQTYHALAIADYVAVLALTPAGRVPIVRQYRPAVEGFTWELPAGLVDSGRAPAAVAVAELQEETGFDAASVEPLGTYFTDTGRLSNRLHAFFVRTTASEPRSAGESGMVVRLVSVDELNRMVLAGEFIHQLHLGVLYASSLRFPSFR